LGIVTARQVGKSGVLGGEWWGKVGNSSDAIALARDTGEVDNGLPVRVAVGESLEDLPSVCVAALGDEIVQGQAIFTGVEDRLDDVVLGEAEAGFRLRDLA
jgi:hypothetical protein